MSQQPILFGSQGSSSQSKYLVEFRAGKCTQNGKLVTPDKRKGLVYIHQGDDTLTHFCWKDRSSSQPEDDFIMMPGDVAFEKVPQCTTGRVFVLKFKSGNKNNFFWMQEPKAEKDDELQAKVNQLLSEPASQRGGSSYSDEENDLSHILANMNRTDIMQLFGGLGGNAGNISTVLGYRNQERNRASRTATEDSAMDTDASDVATTPTATAVSSSNAGAPKAKRTAPGSKNPIIKPQNLAEILDRANSAAGSSGQQQSEVLQSILTDSEVLEPIINNAELMSRVKEFLPQTDASSAGAESNVRSTLKSAQYQQAVSMFSAALASGQMGPVMTQFGMSSDVAAAAATGNLETFIKALEKSKASEPMESEMKDE